MDLEKALDVVMCKSQDVKPGRPTLNQAESQKSGGSQMWPRQLIYPGLVPLNPYLIPYFNTQQHLSTAETGYKGFSEKNEGALARVNPIKDCQRKAKQ